MLFYAKLSCLDTYCKIVKATISCKIMSFITQIADWMPLRDLAPLDIHY